jgi:GNAT superfamily N-acetyltransferase
VLSASRITFEDAKLAARQLKGHHDFHRALARGAPGSRLLELPGVEALVVPACPWFSVINCVFAYEGALALQDAMPELDREYGRAGIPAYRVWVPPEDERSGSVLAKGGFGYRGFVLRMGSYLPGQDLEPCLPLELVPNPTWDTVARCNDRTYRLPTGVSIAAMFSSLDDPTFHLYAARVNDEVVSVLATREDGGNCYSCFMATVPEAQRAGIGTELVRLAKRAARDRGCETSTGESTLVGERLYRKGGARHLGQLYVWERRLDTAGVA